MENTNSVLPPFILTRLLFCNAYNKPLNIYVQMSYDLDLDLDGQMLLHSAAKRGRLEVVMKMKR